MTLSVKTVEEFLLPFDQLWKEKSEMRAMSRIDTNAFVSDLQKVTEQFKQQSDKGSQTQYR